MPAAAAVFVAMNAEPASGPAESADPALKTEPPKPEQTGTYDGISELVWQHTSLFSTFEHQTEG